MSSRRRSRTPDGVRGGVAVAGTTANRYRWPLAVLVVAFLMVQSMGWVWQPILLVVGYVAQNVTRWNRKRRRLLAAAGLPNPGLRELARMRWTHTVRTHQVARNWEDACIGQGLVGKQTKTPPTLRKLDTTVDLDPTALLFGNETGVLPEDVEAKGNRIRQVMGLQDFEVRPRDVGNATLLFRYTDALGRVLPVSHLPRVVDAKETRVAFGVLRDGTAASIRADRSLMSVGLTQMGKSNTGWALVADLLRQGVPFDLFVSNVKQVELKLFSDKVGERVAGQTMRVAGYTETAAGTTEMVKGMLDAMRVRARQQQSKGWTPDEKNPLRILWCDEFLPLTDQIKAGVGSDVGQLLFQGAATGNVAWLSSQVTQIDSVGRLRDLVPQSLCFATKSVEATEAALGKGAEKRGALCSRISTPGVGHMSVDSSRDLTKFRAALVTEDDMELIANGIVPPGMSGVQVETKHRHALYHLSTRDGQMLYIGETNDPRRRLQEHRDDPSKPWCGETGDPDNLVAWEQVEVQWFTAATAKAAEELARKAEEKAIKHLLPLHNEVHNRDNPIRRRRIKPAPQPSDEQPELDSPRWWEDYAREDVS